MQLYYKLRLKTYPKFWRCFSFTNRNTISNSVRTRRHSTWSSYFRHSGNTTNTLSSKTRAPNRSTQVKLKLTKMRLRINFEWKYSYKDWEEEITEVKFEGTLARDSIRRKAGVVSVNGKNRNNRDKVKNENLLNNYSKKQIK